MGSVSESPCNRNTKGLVPLGSAEVTERDPAAVTVRGRRVRNSVAAGGDLKTSEKKVTLKGQVKPFASTF